MNSRDQIISAISKLETLSGRRVSWKNNANTIIHVIDDILAIQVQQEARLLKLEGKSWKS